MSVSALFLFIAFFVALNGTNDCDLADKVLILALPGFISTLIAITLLMGTHRFSIKSGVWISIVVLLVGFVTLAIERSHLSSTAVGDCA